MEEELEHHLRDRGVEESNIREMKDEKIDIEAIKCMDDVGLTKYLKHAGDRYSVKHFCRIKGSLRETFAMKLKQRLHGVDEHKYMNVGTSKGNSAGSTIHGKSTRKISIGWICNGKQIRSNNGGGVRDIDVCKSYKKMDVLKIALDLFFPKGKSTKGCLSNYSYDIYDFKSNNFDDNLTVEQIYEITRLTRVRFFLITTCIENNSESDNKTKQNVKRNKKPKINSKKTFQRTRVKGSYSDTSDDSDFSVSEYLSFHKKRGTKNKTKPKASTATNASTSQPIDIDTDCVSTRKCGPVVTTTNITTNDQTMTIAETDPEISEMITLLEDKNDGNISTLTSISIPVSSDVSNQFYSNYFDEEIFERSNYDTLSSDGLHFTSQSLKPTAEVNVPSDLISELKKIQDKINPEEIVTINACRENTVSSIARALKRSSFSPLKKLDVLFVDSDNISEGVIDAGGPTRELWRLALTELKTSNIFTGMDNSRNIAYNLTFLEKRKYFEAGQIISLALVHGDPGPGFLSNTLFNCIAFGVHEAIPTLDDVGVMENFREILDVSESKNLNELQIAIGNSNLLMEIGVTPIVTAYEEKESIITGVLQHLVIHRPRQAIEQFIEGLNTLDIISLIRKYPNDAKLLFCYNADTKLKATFINDLFFVNHGVEGTKQKTVENQILAYWRDYLQNCEDGDSKVTLENLLSFVTGADKVPALGFPKIPTIQFPHDTICRFPKANTCALILYLPTIELDFDKFVENMDFGILNGLPTFGMP